MSFNIVCDSCTDLTKEDFEKGCYTWIPLTLLIGDEEIVDDDTFDQHSFQQRSLQVSLSGAGSLYGSI